MNLALRSNDIEDAVGVALRRPVESNHSIFSLDPNDALNVAPPPYAMAKPVNHRQAQWSTLSLFSGCGGLDAGFADHGARALAAFDVSASAVATYNRNLPNLAQLADLTSFDPNVARPDILLAGAPCQGFSTAGRRHRGDARNELLGRIVRAADICCPRVIVVENVPAVLSGELSAHWLRLEAGLESLGYNVRRLQLTGVESGLCQTRSRLFLVCWLGSPHQRLELPKIESPALRSVLSFTGASLEHLDGIKPLTFTQLMIARRIRPGQKLSNVRQSPRAVPTWMIPEVFGSVSAQEIEILKAVSILRRRDRVRKFGDGDPVAKSAIERFVGGSVDADLDRLLAKDYLKCVAGRYELVSTFNGRYRRLQWNQPSPTVDTRFGRPELFLHPEQSRGFSSREAARVQGFPDDWKFIGSQIGQFTMIGNAVPPPMASRLADFVHKALLKT